MALFLCHTIIQYCLLVLLIQNQLQISKADSEKNLTFMLIASFGEFGFDSSGAIPAAVVALEDINEDNSILPGYRLVYDKARDSKVTINNIIVVKMALIVWLFRMASIKVHNYEK